MSKKIGRTEKRNADYFPHYVHNSKTIRLLQSKFGNDGYAVWFKILELCAHADEHLGDLKEEIDVLDFSDYALVDELKLLEIIKFLIKLGQIDEGIWIHSRKIWIQGLADNLKPLYEKRVGEVPEKPILGLPDPETILSDTETPISDPETNQEQTFHSEPTRKPHKEEKRREELVKKEENIYYTEIIEELNSICKTSYKSNTPKTKDLINARMNEGFSIDDFKAVIRKKYNDWNNTEYSKFLRPATLFSNKFEGYLNEIQFNSVPADEQENIDYSEGWDY